MSKRTLSLVRIFLGVLIVVGVVWHLAVVHASYNANNIIDDGIFDNSSSMNAAQIDSWLNTNFPNSCISTNNGFSAPEPTGYNPTSGFTYVGTASAGTVIYDAAHVYGLNPQVILATLEKESSVVTGDASYHCQYINTAMGYDCPDAGSCPQDPATESGFSKQVIHAAWMLKFHEQRSKGNVGWDVQMANFPHQGDYWDNSDDPQACYGGRMTQGTYAVCPSGAASYYDGYTTIDGQTVHLDDGATAALYDYTPHFSGNEHFDNIFIGWFGSIYATPYTAGYYSQSAYPQLNPGQSATVYIEYQNLGNNTWYDDQSIGSAPSGSYPVHLATAHPLNRVSAFSASWPSNNRAALTFSTVYLSDGATLAADQHTVQPGEIVKFSFTMTDPASLSAGTYTEYFQPVAEGSPTGLFNDQGTSLNVIVNPSPNIAWYAQSAYPTVAPSDTQANNYMEFTNMGNVPLYDSQSIGTAPSGNYATHLAVECPMNKNSDFVASDWASPNRPALYFAAVYNSDGTTLASNQHIAQPGQIVKFNFGIHAPNGYAASTYQLCLQPVLEGTSTGTYADLGATLNVIVPSEAVINYSGLSSSYAMVSGEESNFSIQVQNVGNLAMGSGATLVTNSNGTAYQDPSWSNSTTMNTVPAISAGASATIPITLLAPTTATSKSDGLSLQINDASNNAIHDSATTLPMQLTAPVYGASYVNESTYPSFTYGQTQSVYLRYKNTGNKPWYDDTSLPTAVSRSPLPTHLATDSPLNRNSGFDYNWPSQNRPALTFSAVYSSDDSTLASSQHVVQPGQIAQFSFTVAAMNGVQPGSYNEYFRPIIEGTPDGAIGFQWTYLTMNLTAPQYNATYYSESSFPTLSDGQSTTTYFEYKNTGNVPWFDNSSISSAPGSSNLYPVHLATSHSLNRSSAFSSTWPTSSRPTLTLSAVYSSDGSMLTSDQHVVQPGQIGKFSFTLSVPNSQPSGTYREFFQPVGEGSMFGAFNDPWTFLDVTVQ